MNDHCINLDLNFSPLRADVDLQDLPTDLWNLLSKDIINPQLVDFLNSKDIYVNIISSFYDHHHNFFNPIHIDSTELSDMSKLIWMWGEYYMMYWYRHKNVTPNVTHLINDSSPELHSRHYCVAEREQLDVVHSSKIGFPSLIQVGVYHRCVTFWGPRRSLTMVLEDKQGHRIPMSAAKLILSPFIKK